MRFLDFCDRNRILVCCYPPHTTRRLQPLDVSVFSPLGTYYSQELDDFIRNSQGFYSITKRDFFWLFWAAWGKALTEDNIKSGFRKTALIPFDPSIVLNQLEDAPDGDQPGLNQPGGSIGLIPDRYQISQLVQEAVVDKDSSAASQIRR
jgi:hypothetical protein